MSQGEFLEILSAQGRKDLDDIVKKLDQAAETVLRINKMGIKIVSPSESKKSIENINKEIQKSNKLKTEAEKLDISLQRANDKLNASRSKTGKELQKVRAEQTQLNREQREESILLKSVGNEYQKLNLQRTQAARRLRDLLASEKASNAEIRRAQVEFNKLDARVRKADTAVRDHTKNVGNYRSALGGLSGQLRTLMSAFGLIGGVMLFARAMRDSIGVIRDFEDQSATLSAILQVSKDEMKGLTDEAVRLGGITAKTAGEVTGLQIAYARLGFNQREIIDLTEATINGSIALNAELDQTANLVGAMVNTFDEFSTADAPKIIDILSLSTARSALNFEKLASGLPTVAGAANAAGVPFTRLVALLGKLADAGIDTGQSATALRNIFIESAKDGLSYEQILDKIKKSQDKLTAANDEFGKRAAVSATVLSNAIDSTKELDEVLQGAAGTAQEMAEKELDTLSGALTLLQSKWQGIILETDRANSISGILTRGIRFLTNNLERILRVIISATGAWVAYRVVIASVSGISRALTAATGLLTVAKVALSGGIKAATAEMVKFNIASKANPAMFLVGILATATAAFLAFGKGVSDSNKELREQRGLINQATKSIRDQRFELNKLVNTILQTNNNSEERNKLIGELNDKYPEFLKNIKDEDFSNKSLKSTLEAVNDEYIKKLAIKQLEAKLDLEGKTEKLAQATGRATSQSAEYEAVLANVEANLKAVGKNTEKVTGDLNQRGDALKKIISDEMGYIAQLRAEGKATTAQIKNLAIYQSHIDAINTVRRRSIGAETEQIFSQKDVDLVQTEIDLLKERLGIKKEEFDQDAIIITAKKRNQDATKKLNEENKNTQELIAGTVAYYQNQIRELESLRDTTARTSEEYQSFSGRIDEARFQLEQLTNQIKILDKVTDQFTWDELEEMIGALDEIDEEALQKFIDEGLKKLQREARLTAEALGAIPDMFNIGLSSGLIDLFAGISMKIDESADKAEQFSQRMEKLGNIAQGVGTIITGVFSAISTSQNIALENQLRNLETQRNVEIEFAGDSAEARAQIEERFAEQKKKIQAEQARNSKAMAIMEATVQTAVAVIKALAVGPPQGILLAALVGALGAAQIAAITAAPIPQFKEGVRNFEGGKAIVGDGGKREPITDKSGRLIGVSPAKSTLVDLPKGANVYKNEGEFYRELNGMLGSNNIIPIPQGDGLSKEDVYEAMKKAIGNSPQPSWSMDKSGIKTYLVNENTRVQILNNRVSGKGRKI